MRDIETLLRKSVDEECFVEGDLEKQKCAVKMDGVVTPRYVIDFDKPGSPLTSNSKRCDYLIIYCNEKKRVVLAPIELKRGKFHAGEVARQLQAGADFANQIVPQGRDCCVLPIAVIGNCSKHERNMIRKSENRIRFRRIYSVVRTMKCGGSLINKLKP